MQINDVERVELEPLWDSAREELSKVILWVVSIHIPDPIEIREVYRYMQEIFMWEFDSGPDFLTTVRMMWLDGRIHIAFGDREEDTVYLIYPLLEEIEQEMQEELRKEEEEEMPMLLIATSRQIPLDINPLR